jgi:hypothetical protein
VPFVEILTTAIGNNVIGIFHSSSVLAWECACFEFRSRGKPSY